MNQIRDQLPLQLTAAGGVLRRFHLFSIEPGALSSWHDLAAELRGGIARSLSPTRQDYDREPGRLALGELTAQLEEIQAQLPGATFVVFLDEFDKIFHRCSDLEQQRIRDSINTLVENDRIHIVFVLSVLQELPQSYASRLAADVFTLHPLTRTESDKLLAELLHAYLLPTTEEGAWIYDYTGGNPYLTRLMVVKIVDLATRPNDDAKVHGVRLEQAARAAVQSDQANHLLQGVYAWYLTDDQRFVLLKLAANGQRVLSPDEFARLKSKHKAAIRQLTSRDYMAEQTDGSFRMRIGFFFDWLYAWEDFDRELERLGVQGRHRPGGRSPKIDAGGICIDAVGHRVYVEGQEIHKHLADLPYRALVLLARRLNTVISKDDLASELWPDDADTADDQRIATVISRLRQALGDRDEKYLQTLHKQGYRLRNTRFV
ncbi:MAG: winged helix-turn-helix domain-containing protein [Anaerolineales bacterium]|nr:winged helix-turn-helix domain-containing protein [Anaerolineales bacterium]